MRRVFGLETSLGKAKKQNARYRNRILRSAHKVLNGLIAQRFQTNSIDPIFAPFSSPFTDGFISRQTPRFVHKLLIHTIISYICTSSRFNILSLPVRFTIADHVQTNSSPTTLSITT